MKLALYYPWIYLHGGIERSMLELLERSRHDWVVYTGYYEEKNTFPGFARHQVVKIHQLTVDRSISAVLKAAWNISMQVVPTEGFEALVVWCDGLGDLVTFRNHQIPIFNICSTPLRPVFDPVYSQHAFNSLGFASKLSFLIFKQLFRLIDRRAWRYYDGVVATSLEVKNRIIKGGLYQEGPRLRLFYPGIDWAAMQVEVSMEPMLLCPGRIMWTKNLELAVNAFLKARLPEPWRLTITGFLDKKSFSYLEKLKQMAGQGNRIEFVISPDDRKLRDLYRRAAVILFPPLNEDWGIVPLEAMAYGKPVIANDSGGPRESVVHGVTGWLLEADPEAWAARLERLPGEFGKLKEMSEQCRIHVKKYDWSKFVKGIDDSFEEWVYHGAVQSF